MKTQGGNRREAERRFLCRVSPGSRCIARFLMNPENPPPYPGPGPTAPYPPYPQQPMGPMGAPPPQGYPYPPPQGYPYQGYPQYGWQGGPQEPPKTTDVGGPPRRNGKRKCLQKICMSLVLVDGASRLFLIVYP
uniref:Cysteine-rich and transmembrane domain-containing protein 1 n=1 Tax=Rattus norvegicus TaxID=10116 RepID=A0ABK0LGP8_RAT